MIKEFEPESVTLKDINFQEELDKFTPKELKEKKLIKIENKTATVNITTIEGIKFRIKWSSEEIQIIGRLNPGTFKEIKVGEYYDDLHQFLIVESRGFQKA